MFDRDEILTVRGPAVRSTFPILVSLVLIWLLKDRFFEIDFGTTLASLTQYGLAHWLTGAGLSGVSFYAISQYDRIAAHLLGLRLTRRDALMSGWRATAIAQVLGYGLITGALVR